MNHDALVSAVKGFLMPVYEQEQPDGRRLYGLGPADFQKVRDGYACAKCLAEYGTYTPVCILCGYQRDVAADMASAPEFWVQSVDERENDRTPYAKVSANPFDEMMARVAADPDVDHVPISELARKRRVRRG